MIVWLSSRRPLGRIWLSSWGAYQPYDKACKQPQQPDTVRVETGEPFRWRLHATARWLRRPLRHGVDTKAPPSPHPTLSTQFKDLTDVMRRERGATRHCWMQHQSIYLEPKTPPVVTVGATGGARVVEPWTEGGVGGSRPSGPLRTPRKQGSAFREESSAQITSRLWVLH